MRHQLRSLVTRLVVATFLVATAAVANAAPITLQTPAGLAPGDHFRFLFVTTGTIDGTSSAVATYNDFVQAQAGGATYGGSVVNWKAIASTASVNARDNVGGFDSLVPVYLPSGAKVATDMTINPEELEDLYSLWSGSLLAPLNEQIDGTSIVVNPWTGTRSDGTADSFSPLGSDSPMQGNTIYDYGSFGYFAVPLSSSQLHPMYGLSEELTVSSSPVPEIDPAGLGSVLALVTGALGLLERRRLPGRSPRAAG